MKQLLNGILKENPVFVLLLGMCPTLAVTTTATKGIGMGLSATAVLVLSNMAISCIRKVVPQKVRIASYIVVISGFVTIIDMLLKAYLPSLSAQLGMYIPLIVVNCIILARAEAFASKNGILASALDGLGMGLGFTLALFIISSIREILGNGTIFGFALFGEHFMPSLMFILPPGGFLVLGLILAIINVYRIKKGEKKHV